MLFSENFPLTVDELFSLYSRHPSAVKWPTNKIDVKSKIEFQLGDRCSTFNFSIVGLAMKFARQISKLGKYEILIIVSWLSLINQVMCGSIIGSWLHYLILSFYNNNHNFWILWLRALSSPRKFADDEPHSGQGVSHGQYKNVRIFEASPFCNQLFDHKLIFPLIVCDIFPIFQPDSRRCCLSASC
jgi:hypothetical protein